MTQERLAIAIHELAHFEMFSLYKIDSAPKILSESERRPLSTGQVMVGVCAPDEFGKKQLTAFQQSVVGWAGYLGEIICGVQSLENCFGIPLNAKTLKEHFHMAMCNMKTFSPSDQMMICAVKNPWPTFKRCYHLLRHKKNKLMKYADFLLAYSPPSAQSIPQPSLNPVADPIKFRADLLRQFLADTSPENLDRPRLERILECLERGEWPPGRMQSARTNLNGVTDFDWIKA